MKTRLLKIKGIVFDERLYPREKYSWQTAYDYSQSMKSGAKFPVIVVGLYKNKPYLIDGKHRIEATKLCKEEYIEAEIKVGLSLKEIYLEAIKANIGHGRQFSPFEKRKIILKLKDMKIPIVQISSMIGISMDKLEEFTYQTVSTSFTTGKPIVLKAPLGHKAGQSVNDSIQIDQKEISTYSQLSLFNQVVTIVKENLIDLENGAVLEKVIELKKLMRKVKIK